MGVARPARELEHILRETREAQRDYWRLRTTPTLTLAKARERDAWQAVRAALQLPYHTDPQQLILATAAREMLLRQRDYFRTRSDATIAAAKKAEKALDEMLEPAPAETQPQLF